MIATSEADSMALAIVIVIMAGLVSIAWIIASAWAGKR